MGIGRFCCCFPKGNMETAITTTQYAQGEMINTGEGDISSDEEQPQEVEAQQEEEQNEVSGTHAIEVEMEQLSEEADRQLEEEGRQLLQQSVFLDGL